MNTCRYCKSNNVVAGEGDYKDYLKCGDCNMYQPDKNQEVSNIIMPEDPMDALMCESCQ